MMNEYSFPRVLLRVDCLGEEERKGDKELGKLLLGTAIPQRVSYVNRKTLLLEKGVMLCTTLSYNLFSFSIKVWCI